MPNDQLPLTLPAQVEWDASLTSLHVLPMLRTRLREWAYRNGFASSATLDVLVAVNEVAANAFVHGQPPVQVNAWRSQDTLVVQVDDHGGTPLPAWAGYRPPGRHQDRHYGLWLARQLADVVQTRTADAITSVRLYFPYQLTYHARSGAAVAFGVGFP
jgi:anti-sigma regulatory factor (Ser/Thr protein kinase)